MSLFHTLRDLLFVPRCVVCKKRLPPSLFKDPAPVICLACLEEWERETLLQCKSCFCEHYRCLCPPPLLKKRGVEQLVKLAPYGEGVRHRATRELIAQMKRSRLRSLYHFAAEELVQGVSELVRELEEDVVVTFLPRSHRALRTYGHDQAKELARALAIRLDLDFAPLLLRKKDGKQQKRLDVRHRAANIKGAFGVLDGVNGRHVLLVDDVVTTGASMGEAAALLLSQGARSVVGVCVAATEKKKS